MNNDSFLYFLAPCGIGLRRGVSIHQLHYGYVLPKRMITPLSYSWTIFIVIGNMISRNNTTTTMIIMLDVDIYMLLQFS